MKKRIFAAFIAALLLVCSMATCFAEGQDAPLAVKNPAYDQETKTLSFTVANLTNETVYINTVMFNADANAVTLEYPGVQYGSDLKAGAEVEFKLKAEIPNFDAKNPPAFGLAFNYAFHSTNVDLTKEVSFTDYKIDDIFANDVTPMGAIVNFLKQTGFMAIAANWKILVMLLISFVLMYLAIVKKFEPLLLLPIAFGMLLTNLPGAEMFHEELFADGHVHWELFGATNSITPGLIDYLYLGVKLGIYPCLIFMGVGAMTDFSPLIANPKSLLLGAAAQLGIFGTFFAASFFFSANEAAAIASMGGADGPTAILVASKLAPDKLAAIAIAAYSYMALVPLIQPPIMRALTTKKEREIVMTQLRPVSKRELVIFPIATAAIIILILPSTAPLIGSLMFGNLLRVCGVTERLSKTAQNELCNIVTIFLGTTVGATATASSFLNGDTFLIIIIGLLAFCAGTAGGVLLGKLMCILTGGKINPLIGSAGVSAVPMAARVSQKEGQKANPKNFLLMHAMGPNVAGVIGSAVAAGVLLAMFS